MNNKINALTTHLLPTELPPIRLKGIDIFLPNLNKKKPFPTVSILVHINYKIIYLQHKIFFMPLIVLFK